MNSSKMIEVLKEDILNSAHYLILLKGAIKIAGEEYVSFRSMNHEKLNNIVNMKTTYTIKHTKSLEVWVLSVEWIASTMILSKEIASKKLNKFKKSLVEWRANNSNKDELTDKYIIHETKRDKILDMQMFLWYDLKNIAVIFDCLISHCLMSTDEIKIEDNMAQDVEHIKKLFIQRLMGDQGPIKRIVLEGFFKLLNLSDLNDTWEIISNILILYGKANDNILINDPIRDFISRHSNESNNNIISIFKSLWLATSFFIKAPNMKNENEIKAEMVAKISKMILPLFDPSNAPSNLSSDLNLNRNNFQIEWMLLLGVIK